MAKTTEQRFHEWRKVRPDLTAATALAFARCEAEQESTLARFGEWTFDGTGAGYGTFAYADLDADLAYTVRVGIGDDDQPTEWGDCEPTDAERAAATSYYVCVVVLNANGDELYHDGIGGVDIIDLPGYLQRTWEDAAAYALSEYLLSGAIRFVEHETGERAYWASRDVETVD